MAPKIRKRPKPADSEPKAELKAEAPPPPPPADPPPPVAYTPPVLADGCIPCPRSPEEIIHNVMVRQLQDDLADPPAPEPEHPALALLRKVQEARDKNQPLEQFQEEAARVLYGVEMEERFTVAAMRVLNLRKLRRQIESDEHVDKFLHRCLKRGDLNSREALVFKQMNVTEMNKTIKELLDRLESPQEAFGVGDLTKMDYTLQITDKTTQDSWKNTTPQGREIIRKITFRARRQLYENQLPK